MVLASSLELEDQNLADNVTDAENKIPVRCLNAASVGCANNQSLGVKKFNKETSDGHSCIRRANPQELYLEWKYLSAGDWAVARDGKVKLPRQDCHGRSASRCTLGQGKTCYRSSGKRLDLYLLINRRS